MATFPTVAPTPPTALNISHSPDVIGWLPEGAQDRLRALRQHVADLNALIPASEVRLAAANAKVGAEQRLSRLRAHQSERGGGFNLKDDDPRVVAALEHRDKLTADAKRINDLYQMRSAAWTAASHTLSAVQTYLVRDGRSGGTALEDFDGPEPALQKGESVVDGIERIRRRVRELRADLHRIRSAPYPSSHCKQRAREMITDLAERGRPSVSALIEQGRDLIEWPTQMMQVTVHNAQPGAVGFIEQIDTVALLAHMFKDQLIAKLDAEIAAEADDQNSLSHTEREKREAVVQGDLLAAERDESWFVWQALAQGLPVFHRNDASPLAILQCALVAAPREAASGTTPGYSFNMRR